MIPSNNNYSTSFTEKERAISGDTKTGKIRTTEVRKEEEIISRQNID